MPSAAHGEDPPTTKPPPAGGQPGKGTHTVHRIIRDTRITRWVKRVHDDTCQVCGLRLVGADGPFSEGAHIRPLGARHEGPDEVENVLCLCPNHHALLDRGAFVIEDDFALRSMHGVPLLDRLRTRSEHVINTDHLRYHRVSIAKGGSMSRSTGL